MVLRNRAPAWHRDVKWASGLALVLVAAAATLFVSLAQIAERERAVPLLHEALRATLLPGGDAASLEVRRAAGYAPGEALRLLPGVDVEVDASEIPGFTVDEGISRIAGVWTQRLLAGGVPAVLSTVEEPTLAAQLERAFDGAGARLFAVSLESAMLPAGLDDGSRMANWPLQAQQNPGQPVQPIVGVLVRLEPDAIQNLDERQIGEAIVARLAGLVLESGADAAREPVTNGTVAQRLSLGLERGRAEMHDLFETMLLPRSAEIDGRLQEARTVLAGEDRAPVGLAGILPAAELADLPAEEANRQVLEALAERTWERGAEALPPLLEPSGRAERIVPAMPLLDGLTAEARARYQRWAWLMGGVAVLLVVLLVAASGGWGRLLNPGIALVLAAAGGALASTRGAGALAAGGAEASPPPAVAADGAFAQLRGALGQFGQRVPPDALDVLARNHMVVVALGGALVVVAVLGWATARLRPRRRSYL